LTVLALCSYNCKLRPVNYAENSFIGFGPSGFYQNKTENIESPIQTKVHSVEHPATELIDEVERKS
jgi:hypothetical protein